MTNKFELYKCNICGNVIEVLISGDGHPVCCGKEMEKLEVKNDTLNSPDLTEKHTPKIIHEDKNNITVTVEKHPMEEEHYIQFVQIISDSNDEILAKFFHPKEEAKMNAKIENNIKARSYCNIHGVYAN